jgi:hypothetical protein
MTEEADKNHQWKRDSKKQQQYRTHLNPPLKRNVVSHQVFVAHFLLYMKYVVATFAAKCRCETRYERSQQQSDE